MACLCLRTQKRSQQDGLAGPIQTFLTTRTYWLTKPLEVSRGFWWLGVKKVRGRVGVLPTGP